MKKLLFFAFLIASSISIYANTENEDKKRISKEEYIQKWKNEAVRQMLLYKIPASITMAQAILESGSGNSGLARVANNHFGIKCHGWEGKFYIMDDDEKDECFRHYDSANESFHDHSEFLNNRARYNPLFELNPKDYKAWAKGLKKAGYATNPKYPTLLINIIESQNLHELDYMTEVPPNDEDIFLASADDEMDKPVEPVKKEAKPIEGTEKEQTILIDKREVLIHENNVKYIIVREGDSYEDLAKEYGTDIWQLRRHNDLNKGDQLPVGETLFLQPKRFSNKKVGEHVVEEGESMRDIAQKYGIRLKSLYRKNSMIPGTKPKPGQKLSLNRKILAAKK